MSLYKEQKVLRPKIEDVAGKYLDADRTAAILNFTGFLRANKVSIRWISSNSWKLLYKKESLGYIKIYTGILGKPAAPHLYGSWYFCQQYGYLSRYYEMDDSDLKRFIFDNIYAKNCGNCICTNPIPNDIKIGYMEPTGCKCWPLRIFNPDGEWLEYTKLLIEHRMNFILEENELSA